VFSYRLQRCLAVAVVCCVIFTVDEASGQQAPVKKQAEQKQPDSREVRTLKTVERHFGTVGAGAFVILLGASGIARAVWITRPVFRGDSLWYKLGVAAVVLAGIFMIAIGIEIAQWGWQGKSLDQWLESQD
jgi:hypothetical protein